MLGVAVIWGVNIPIMKTGLEQVDVYVFNAIRLFISAVVLTMFAYQERRRSIYPRPGVTRSQLFTYGLANAVLYQLLFLLGIARTSAGNTALIIATVPMWTALLAWLLIKETLRPLAWFGLVIGLCGTLIITGQKVDVVAGQQHLWGNMLVLGAALTWAGCTVYSRRLLRCITPMQLSATSAIVGLPCHVLFAWGRFPHEVVRLQSLEIWLIIAYAGVLSSGLSLFMWNFGVRSAGAAHAAVFQNLIPVVALGVAWMTRGEVPSATQLFGGSLILGGLIVMRVARG